MIRRNFFKALLGIPVAALAGQVAAQAPEDPRKAYPLINIRRDPCNCTLHFNNATGTLTLRQEMVCYSS